MKTAGEAGLGVLYHYQGYEPGHVETVLLGNKIKFSNPSSFNDPWDCRPRFSKSILKDPAGYERTIAWLTRVGREHGGVSEDELTRRAEALRNDRRLMERIIDDNTSQMRRTIDSKYRVFCLLPHPDSMLMWAHYGKQHHGICFGFSTDSLFAGAFQVHYSPQYPEIDLSSDNETSLIRDALLSKAQDWRYENEYRLVAKEGSSEGFLVVQDGFIEFEPRALRQVVVGAALSDDHLTHLRRVIGIRSDAVEVLRARPADDRYALVLSSDLSPPLDGK